MKLVFLVILSLYASAEAAVQSKIVGKAGEHYFTSREVQINYALEHALMMPPKVFAKKNLELPVEGDDFRIELNGVFLEWVVAKEAVAFSVAKVPENEFQQALKVLGGRLDKRKTWVSLQVSRTEFLEFLRRKLRAKKFIQFKADSSVIDVTDQEAKEYYRLNKERFGSVPLESFKEKIKVFLRNKKRDDRLQSWFEVLQKKYEVRSFVVGSK